MIQIGGGSKKNKGRKKKEVVEYEESFQLELPIIKKFGMLGIAAPVVSEDLDDRLKKVAEKKQYYLENGESKQKERIDEIVREAKEEEKEYEVQEEVEEQPAPRERGGRGGRGNRGGYRGGRGGSSRGRGRGGFGGQMKSEFDGEDDDDYVYSAPSKGPKRANKQEDLKMDEDNYPAL